MKPGDFDGDGLVTSTDVAAFVNVLLENSAFAACAGDMNLDGIVDAEDIQAFIGSM